MDRKVIHTRHVLAVKDLAISAEYFKRALGFDLDFTAPGWEFLSFGIFKVMLGECADEMSAGASGNHSYFAHALVEDVDSIYAEFKANGAMLTSVPQNQPWGIREFGVTTPDGHRITFGQLIEG
ncbi:MAG: VOC family protein [Pyrinomonadaceae bacterium]